tara:strand:- start:109 stop:1032 length:924 start_codon:yes stop_codon:yes gene_type:complete
MREEFIEELSNLAKQDRKVFLITADLGFGALDNFKENFPNQYLNVGVAEQNMTAIAAGLALEGFKVFTYSIGIFPTFRCLEQIRNDICYHNLDVTIVSTGAGFSYGQLGVSHFAIDDISVMRSLPGMSIISPSDGWQIKILLNQIYKNSSPKYIRIDKSQAFLKEKSKDIKFGNATKIRSGDDISLVCYGGITSEAIKVSEILAKENIFCRVLEFHTLKPFDYKSLISAAIATRYIFSIEEHNINGGIGSICAEFLAESGINYFFRRFGLPDKFPHIVGDQYYLRSYFSLDAQSIAAKCKSFLKNNK